MLQMSHSICFGIIYFIMHPSHEAEGRVGVHLYFTYTFVYYIY